MQRMRKVIPAGAAYVAWLAVATGCGGDFGAELSSRPQPTALASMEEARLVVPRDQPFSIHRAPSQRDPGLAGTAEAHAAARPDGTAQVDVRAADGGTATADFQLGHAFRNDTDRQMDLSVAVRYQYEYEVAPAEDDAPVEGGVGLKLYVRDHRNRLRRNDDLVAHPVSSGGGSRSGDELSRFRVTLAPGGWISVYLAGQATVTTELGRSGGCALTLRGVQMEVVTRAAPAVDGAADEQG